MTTRTVTYKVSFDVSGVKAGSRSMQLTMKTMEQDADKAKATMEQLAKSMGDKYGVKTDVAVDVTKSMQAALRDASRQANATERNYQNLIREYTHMKTRVGLAADQQEVLNAQFRLGANASEQQKREVAELVREYQRLRSEATKTQGSMRGFRGQMQNIGFQAQDIAVQMQAGTDAMIIFGQQGSQLAAGFGATGALVGAGIAFAAMLGSVLAPSLFKSSEAVKDLNEKLKELARTYGLTEEQAAFMNETERKGIQEKAKTIRELEKEKGELKFLNQTYEEYREGILSSIEAQNDLRTSAGSVGVGLAPGIDFTTVKTQKQFAEAQRESELEQKRLNSAISILTKEIEDSQKAMKTFDAATKGALDEQEKFTQGNDQIVDALKEQVRVLGKTQSEVLLLNKQRDLEKLAAQNATAAEIELTEAAYDVLIARQQQVENEKEIAIAQREAAKAAREVAKAEKEKQQVLSKFSDSGRLQALERQYKRDLELATGNAEAIKNIEEFYANERIKITGNAWEQYLAQARTAIKTTDELIVNSLDRLTTGFGDALTQIALDSTSPADALKNMFESGLRSMLRFFGEWAAQKVIAWTLDKTLGKTAQAGAAAASGNIGASEVIRAGLSAFASTAAIPIVGPSLAPAAASAAVAATSPMAAAMAALQTAAIGVYDKGGRIPSGGAGIVSEIGDELVGGTMVYNGSPNSLNVTGREDTARAVGGGVDMRNMTINSYGNASAESIARAIVRRVKKGDKKLATSIYDAAMKGAQNKGKRFNV